MIGRHVPLAQQRRILAAMHSRSAVPADDPAAALPHPHHRSMPKNTSPRPLLVMKSASRKAGVKFALRGSKSGG
jgi:hypothetical protein